MRLRWMLLAGSGAILAAVGCAGPGSPEMVLDASIEEPHAAADGSGPLAMVWGNTRPDGTADIICKRAGGAGLLRVNRSPGSAVAGRQVGPRAASAARGKLLVSWVDRGRDPSGDILVAAIAPGAAAFEPPVRVDDEPALAGQEYQDIAALPDGTVALVWLDERDAGREDSNRKQVYFARSRDGGRTFEASRPLTRSPQGVCPCCRPSLAASPDGSLHVVYRDREGSMLFVRMRTLPPGAEEFLPPATLSPEGWRYLACPVDGPAALARAGGLVDAVWMEGAGGEHKLWHAASRDGGRSFQAARLAIAPGGLAELAGDLTGSLASTDAAPPSGEARQSRPSLGWSPDTGLVLAWEDADGKVWAKRLDAPGKAPLHVAGGKNTFASSAHLAADPEGLHILWRAEEWGGGKEPASMRPARLGTARLVFREGELRIE